MRLLHRREEALLLCLSIVEESQQVMKQWRNALVRRDRSQEGRGGETNCFGDVPSHRQGEEERERCISLGASARTGLCYIAT